MSVSIYSTCDIVALITVLWAGSGWEVFGGGRVSEMLHISKKQSLSIWNQAFKTGDKITGVSLTS